MNKRFFIHEITVYHTDDDENYTRIHFGSVYFRHNKKTNLIDKRARKGQYWNNYNTNNRRGKYF